MLTHNKKHLSEICFILHILSSESNELFSQFISENKLLSSSHKSHIPIQTFH